jgi:hypothetical protein
MTTLFRLKQTTLVGDETQVTYTDADDFQTLCGLTGGMKLLYGDAYNVGTPMADPDDGTVMLDEIEIQVDGAWMPISPEDVVANADKWENYIYH